MNEAELMSRSINILSLMTIVGVFEGMFISLYLLFKRSAKSHANRYLGGAVLVVVSVMLPGFAFRIGSLPDVPHFVHIHLTASYLFGPFVYLYIRACTQKDFEFKHHLWWHFLPFLLALAYYMPFYLQSGEAKVLIFLDYFLRGKHSAPMWIRLVGVLQYASYFGLCLKLVSKYKKHLKDATSLVDESFHRWLLVFCAFLLLPLITVASFALTGHRLLSATGLLTLLFFFVLLVHIAVLVKPGLFHPFPHQTLIPDSKEEQRQKYENSTLQPQQKDQYVEELLAFMKDKKPYLTPDLTLSDLSKQIGVSSHHLSQIINERLECHFLDFINRYRVKEAQSMLINPDFQHLTIIAIAYEAGFNSKSTFYSVFKKETEMTPSQYRKQAVKVPV